MKKNACKKSKSKLRTWHVDLHSVKGQLPSLTFLLSYMIVFLIFFALEYVEPSLAKLRIKAYVVT